MNVKEIVTEYLKKNGYDGLYNPGECGCTIDDLMCCDDPADDCYAGYLAPCDCGQECAYHIGPKE